MLIDTHSHLFLEEFSEDLPQVMERARKAGVSHIFMPNIDSMTIEPMLSVCADYPDLCYPMIGLHPTSVNETYERELAIVRERLSAPNNFVAIGEIGLDLYWDKTFLNEQLEFEGFMLGINGVVTFKKSTLPDTLRTVPLERIVLETDSPYLTPVPNRGKRNESANVRDTFLKIAEIYQMNPEYVAQVTTENALKVFVIRK